MDSLIHMHFIIPTYVAFVKLKMHRLGFIAAGVRYGANGMFHNQRQRRQMHSEPRSLSRLFSIVFSSSKATLTNTEQLARDMIAEAG